MIKERGYIYHAQVGLRLPFLVQFFVNILIQKCLGLGHIDCTALEKFIYGRTEILVFIVHVASDRFTGFFLLIFGNINRRRHLSCEIRHVDIIPEMAYLCTLIWRKPKKPKKPSIMFTLHSSDSSDSSVSSVSLKKFSSIIISSWI